MEDDKDNISETKISDTEKIEKLRFALANQIEWQKYAEGKNLVFLTICAGTLLFIYNHIDSLGNQNSIALNWFFIFFMFTSIASFFIGLISLKFWYFPTVFPDKISLISWDYIRKHKVKEIKEVLDKYDNNQHLDDLIIQHFYGSKIVSQKYNFFSIGIIIYSIGILSLIIDFIYKCIKHLL